MHVFLVLAHDRPRQLWRLIGRLPDDSPVFVHVDERADQTMWEEVKDLPARHRNVRFVERRPCYWGSWAIVESTLTLVRAAVTAGLDFDHATLLSGTDYPIVGNDRFAVEVEPGVEYIESFRLDRPNRWSQHEGLYRVPGRIYGRHLRYRSRVTRVGTRRRLPQGLLPYGGSQWWTLSRDCLDWVDRYVTDHPEVGRFVSRSFIPDELFFQTVVSNSPFADAVSGTDRRYAVWDRPEPPYPALLGTADLSAIVASDAWFARKFDASFDADVFDLIDAHVDSLGSTAPT
ncbi:MAG: hypothetical protein KF906_09555 [Actinobacteria bacterium]|nr:hypothetical protein [Actinomycetota bacterium]